ncbi:MAG: rod shape-determining protein MreD [Candidatus Adiutrix sp.]|jgi:rod shape-determining protein MreD|nr:rod shape-determining protein MreD [Candidatus Adiutrix sp.]
MAAFSKLYVAAPAVFKPRDFFRVIMLGLGLVVFQSSVIAWAGISGYGPEWVWPLAVYVALRSELWVAVLAAFLLGFFRDAVGGGFLGLHQFTLALVIWLFHSFRPRLDFFAPLTLMTLILVLSLGGCLFVMTPIMAALGWPSDHFNPWPVFFFSSSSSALVAPFLFRFLQWLTREREKRHD